VCDGKPYNAIGKYDLILLRAAHVYWFLTRVVKANLLINNQGRRERAHTVRNILLY
jgi:hypothetical protein